METLRKPLQGLINIIRFNWPFFAISFVLIFLLFVLANFTTDILQRICFITASLLIAITSIPVLVSLYIYDLSGLYSFKWLKKYVSGNEKLIVNINAGFDETSEALKLHFNDTAIKIFDFYDEKTHTEPSIKRARDLYPQQLATQMISTSSIPLSNNSVSKILLIFAAHEIRNNDERILFFKELNRILAYDGQIFLMEHLRNTPNFLAYNIGFFHFYSKATWLKNFNTAKLKLVKEIKHTPFISIFVLEKNGTAY